MRFLQCNRWGRFGVSFHGEAFGPYVWELTFLNTPRAWKDGVTFFDFLINLDRYPGDHSPRLELDLVLLNVNLIEFSYHFRYHRDDEGRPILPEPEFR
jgi:hypothetical protein